MNWFDYRQKLGLGFDDDHMLGFLKNIMSNKLTPLYEFFDSDALRYYVNTVGLKEDEYRTYTSRPLAGIMQDILLSDSVADYVSRFIVVINSFQHRGDQNKKNQEVFLKVLTDTLDQCRILYDIFEDEDGLFIFPKGVPEFDKELVSDNLLWLSKYPETEKAWVQALREYASKEDPRIIADSFRVALERFFQNFFQKDRSLENLKPEYGQYLKDHGVPSEIAANLENLLQQYTNYMNNYAKHHDRVSCRILEYVMYQTGNIIRLLIKLSEEDA